MFFAIMSKQAMTIEPYRKVLVHCSPECDANMDDNEYGAAVWRGREAVEWMNGERGGLGVPISNSRVLRIFCCTTHWAENITLNIEVELLSRTNPDKIKLCFVFLA